MRLLERPSLQSKVNSLFNSVTYRLGSIVIDPGDVQNWEGVQYVLLTHAHFDHIYGLNALCEINPQIKVYTNQFGYLSLLDPKLNLSKYHGEAFAFEHPNNITVVKDNDIIMLDNGLSAKAIFTPGHNDSCIIWEIDNLLFTGDSYIPGIKVVTNIPGANKAQAAESLKKIIKIAEGHTVCPGHKL